MNGELETGEVAELGGEGKGGTCHHPPLQASIELLSGPRDRCRGFWFSASAETSRTPRGILSANIQDNVDRPTDNQSFTCLCPTMASHSDPLQQLQGLDKDSPQFYEKLSDFLRGNAYRDTFPSALESDNLVRFIEFLDSVSPLLYHSLRWA